MRFAVSAAQLAEFLKKVATAVPPPMPPAPPATPPVNKATLAFQVVDEASGEAVADTFITIDSGLQVPVSKQANEDGYAAFELPVGLYGVKFDALDFAPIERPFKLEENRQFKIKLHSTKPDSKPVVQPNAPPPVIAPPAPAPVVNSLQWSTDTWREHFFAILKQHKAPATVNLDTLNDTRADIEALGAEWQHDSAGTLRPRLFLPVAPGADRFSRAVDVGLYGESWQWIKR